MFGVLVVIFVVRNVIMLSFCYVVRLLCMISVILVLNMFVFGWSVYDWMVCVISLECLCKVVGMWLV